MARNKEAKPAVAPAQDKDKAAELVTAEIEKKHGAGSFMRLGANKRLLIDVIPTGIYQVDHFVLGAGGFPRGRIVEVFGPESSGKTTLALTVAAQAQRMGGKAAFIDAEHALDPAWAAINGVDTDALFVSQPNHGEQALDITDSIVRSGAFDVIVVDSVAALTPLAELQGDYGDSNVGLQARMMSQAMRKLTNIVDQSRVVLIFINQIREKVGVMFGSPETTTGGRALKFFASVRMDVRKRAYLKEGEHGVPYGNIVEVKAVKNKIGNPFRECEVNLLYDSGFDKAGSLLDAADMMQVLEKTGSWYNLDGERLANGRAAMAKLVREDDALYRRIYAAVIKKEQEPKQ